MKDTKPFFSVIVPVYNKEQHISRSINSILNQTFNNFELLIVCDPSTDNSDAEVAKFKDPRIRVFHRKEPGPGGYAARNLGIKHAKSDWIAFLDADDEWYPHHLESYMNEILNNRDIKILTSGWKCKDKNIALSSFYKSASKSMAYSFEDYLKSFIEKRGLICTIVACIRKDILVSAGMFPENKIMMGGDIDTWTRCMALARELYYVHSINAVYYRDSVNMVTRTSVINPRLHVFTAKKLMEDSENKGVSCLIMKMANVFIFYAWTNNLIVVSDGRFELEEEIFEVDLSIKHKVILLISKLPKILRRPVFVFLKKLY